MERRSTIALMSGYIYLTLIIMAVIGPLIPLANGGVVLSLALDQPVYLQGESIVAILTIHNEMDDPIVVWPDSRDSETRIECRIERHGDELVIPRKNIPLVDRLGVNPDQSESVMLMLSEQYDLYEIGRYRAVMELHLQGKLYESKMQIIDIVKGLEIDNIQRAVRGYPDNPRQYSLRYLTRNRGEYLFLVVDDDRFHFGSFMLGPLIRFQKPGITVDRDGRIVVYHQSSPTVFTRSVFQSDPSEVRFIDQVYVYEDGSPYRSEKRNQAAGTTNPAISDRNEAKDAVDLKPSSRSGGLFGRWFGRK